MMMTSSKHSASADRVARFQAILQDPETNLYDALRALERLSDTDLELTGKSRTVQVDALLKHYAKGETP